MENSDNDYLVEDDGAEKGFHLPITKKNAVG
jgi:hypothetical protein